MFTPKIKNPIKGGVLATEILLNDRLITNDQLEEFFINIPKRIDLIENAADVSDNLDAFALSNDVEQNKSNIIELQGDVKNNNNAIERLENLMGEKLISGTVQWNLDKLWDTVFGTEGLIEYITDVHDDVINIKNNDLVNMQEGIDSNKSSIDEITETLEDHIKRIVEVENKASQIDVNTADVKVMQAQIQSMQAQIEQIRTECNNYLTECWKAIDALRALH